MFNFDFNTHVAILQLLIGYTLVGAFIFTVIITCLSLVGIVRFADPGHQKTLFGILIVELVVISVAVFSDLIRLSPAQAVAEVTAPLEGQIETARAAEAQAQESLSELATASEALRDSLTPAMATLSRGGPASTEAGVAPQPAGADVSRVVQSAEALDEVLSRVRAGPPAAPAGQGS